MAFTLSKRLKTIGDVIDERYSHIWDCCCDHGQLGRYLLDKTSAVIHFVDREPHLVSSLCQSLQDELGGEHASRCRVHCEDVQKLSLESCVGRQLVVIAGVGGATCIELLKALNDNHPTSALDFIVCPVRQIEQLRHALTEMSLGLRAEYWLEDRHRAYEVLYVRRNGGQCVGVVGQKFWCWSNPVQRQYVVERINYLVRSSSKNFEGASQALRAYREVLQKFETLA